MHRLSSEQLSRWEQQERGTSSPVATVDPSRVAVGFVERAVGWFLHDPATWRRLEALYTVDLPEWERLKRKYGRRWPRCPPRVPRLPPGWGREWKTIFETVYHRFRTVLNPQGDEERDGRWISYSLSYIALRQCAVRGKHGEMAYVYRACVNAHKRFRRRLMAQRRLSPWNDGLERVDIRSEPTDLMLDLESVLQTFPDGDAAVCRMRLVEGQTFQAIGAALGIDPSTAQRRYERRIGAVQTALSDYVDESPSNLPFNSRNGRHDLAA